MIEKLTAMQDRMSQRIEKLTAMQSQRCLKSSQPCRIGCPGNDWKAHRHAGQAVPDMLGKAHSHAGQAVPDMLGKFTAMQDSLSQRCLKSSRKKPTAMQGRLSQRCLRLSKHVWDSLSCVAVSFWNISGASYPAWLSALQASLGQAILHGCELSQPSDSSVSDTSFPTWLWAFQAALGCPAWLWAFQACLGLDGCEAFLVQPILHGCELFKDLWTAYPAWLWAFQSSLREPILHGRELFKHVWDNLSCIPSICGKGYPAWLSALWLKSSQPCRIGCRSSSSSQQQQQQQKQQPAAPAAASRIEEPEKKGIF